MTAHPHYACRTSRILRHPTGVGWSAIHPASTCAVPDLIADVSAHTPARTLRAHRTRPMLARFKTLESWFWFKTRAWVLV
jgi:hypothetical protein